MPPHNLPSSNPSGGFRFKREDLKLPSSSSPKIPHSSSSGSGNGGAKLSGGVGIALMVLAIVWYIFGGSSGGGENKKKVAREEARQETSQETQREADGDQEDTSGEGLRTSRTETPIPPKSPEPSLYSGWVELSRGTVAEEVYPEKEFAEIDITRGNLSSVDISGWTLRNAAGKSVRLGRGAEFYLSGNAVLSPIRVKGGDRIIVSAGHSPVGVSFKTNACSGYLEQFLDFTPEIPVRCPRISDDVTYDYLEDSCKDFVRSLPECTANTQPFPDGIGYSCRYFVTASVNYNACAVRYKNDPDFYEDSVWRVFLNQDREMWSEENESVLLFDAAGNLIDEVKY